MDLPGSFVRLYRRNGGGAAGFSPQRNLITPVLAMILKIFCVHTMNEGFLQALADLNYSELQMNNKINNAYSGVAPHFIRVAVRIWPSGCSKRSYWGRFTFVLGTSDR